MQYSHSPVSDSIGLVRMPSRLAKQPDWLLVDFAALIVATALLYTALIRAASLSQSAVESAEALVDS